MVHAVALGDAASHHRRSTVRISAMPHAAEESDELAEFLLALGRAQLNAGFPVDTVTNTLAAAAESYGFESADVAVLPGAVFLNLGPNNRGLFVTVNASLTRFDQSAAIANVARRATRGEVTAADGLAELERMPFLPERFPRWATILGYALVAAGFSLVYRYSLWDPVVAAVLGVVVGVSVQSTRSNQALNVLMAPLMGLVCGAAVFIVASKLGAGFHPLHVVVASLIILLPGAALTRATMEMASGHIIAGGSRLMWAVMQLALLAAGIVVGARLVGVTDLDPPSDHLAKLPIWVAFAAVGIYAVGQGLARNMPKGSIWIILLLLIGAQSILMVVSIHIGAVFGSAIAATAMLLAAIIVEQRGKSHLPAVSLFTPVFWLLVPGSVGLIGLANALNGEAEARGTEITAGANLLLESGSVIIAILVGMQVASLLGEAQIWRRQQTALGQDR